MKKNLLTQNQIVKYDNKFNLVQQTNFTKRERVILALILSKLANQGELEILIPFSEFRNVPGFEHKTNKEIKKFLLGDHEDTEEGVYIGTGNGNNGFYDKMCRLNLSVITPNGGYVKPLFDKLAVTENNDGATVSIPHEYSWIVNDPESFTIYDLLEYARLSTRYAQALFTQLKQWKSVGKKTFTIEEIRLFLDIPESVPSNKVLAKYVLPAAKAIEKNEGSFRSIKVKKLLAGREHRITGVEISFITTPSVYPEKKNSSLNKYNLGVQSLTEEEYDDLIKHHPQSLVDKTINRILDKPYYGMLDKETISKWCEEDKRYAAENNSFNNFSQRTYNYAEIEEKIYNNPI